VGIVKAVEFFELSLMMQYSKLVSSRVAQTESAGALCNDGLMNMAKGMYFPSQLRGNVHRLDQGMKYGGITMKKQKYQSLATCGALSKESYQLCARLIISELQYILANPY
jgi:hypothetical protein